MNVTLISPVSPFLSLGNIALCRTIFRLCRRAARLSWIRLLVQREVPVGNERSALSGPKAGVFLTCTFVVAFGCCGNVHAISILKGSDYLSTVGAEFFNLDLTSGQEIPLFKAVVPPAGVVGPGNTDTIIRRLEDGTGFSGNTPQPPFEKADIEASVLLPMLQSKSLVEIDGMDYEIRINFETQGTGELRYQHEFGSTDEGFLGGSVSVLDPFFATMTLGLTPTTGGPETMISQVVSIEFGSSNFWRSTPPSNALLVTGSRGDPLANTHVPLDGDIDAYPDTAFDLWAFVIKIGEEQVGEIRFRHAVSDRGSTLNLLGFAVVSVILLGRKLCARHLEHSKD